MWRVSPGAVSVLFLVTLLLVLPGAPLFSPLGSRAPASPPLSSTDPRTATSLPVGSGSVGPSFSAAAPGPASNLTWPMFLHDQERTAANLEESVLSVGNTSGLVQLWDYSLNRAVTGSTVVANGSVYFGAWNGIFYAVNEYNGSLEWKTTLGGAWTPYGCNEPGIAATPALWNGTLFIGGANPWLYAVSASNGSILWHVDLANATGSSTPWTAHKIWSSAVVYNGSVYVGMASGCDTPLVRGALFQIALSDHTITHTFWTIPASQIGPGIWSSPSVDPASNTVWVTTGNEGTMDTKYARALVELNASNVSQVLGYVQEGAVFQDLDFGDGASLFHSSTGTPMVVAINKNGVTYAFNDSSLNTNGTGPAAWTLSLHTTGGASYAPPAYDGQLLYIGTVAAQIPGGGSVAGSVLAVYPDNGTVKWWVGVAAAVYGGLTYANGLVWAGDTSQHLIALNSDDGSVVSTSSPGAVWGEPIVLNGEVLCTSGTLYGAAGDVTAYGLALAANFTATVLPGPSQTTVGFSAKATGGVLPDNVTWSFGDGSTGYGGVASHHYAAAGIYTVFSTLRDARGVSVSSNLTVNADVPLTATPYEPTNPMNLGAGAFIGVNAVGGTAPYAYNWSGLPPGSQPVNATPDLFLVQPYYEGLYFVNVTVSSPSGQQVTVVFAPLFVDGPLSYQIIASPPSGLLPLTVDFSAVSSFPNATGTYQWDFGDGHTSSALAPSNTYATPAVYTVTLTVGYAGGSRATASRTVTAADLLVLVGPDPVTIDPGSSLALAANASGGAGVYTFNWTGLPAGCSPLNASQIVCVPTGSGAFPVAVMVSDPIGGSQTAYVTVVVNDPLSLGASIGSVVAPGCGANPADASVHLASLAQGGQTPYAFVWTGPNRTSASDADSTWSVPAPGIYTFRVNVTDAFGSTASTTVSVTANAPTCTPSSATDFWSSGTGTVAIVLGLLVVLVVASALVVRWRRR